MVKNTALSGAQASKAHLHKFMKFLASFLLTLLSTAVVAMAQVPVQVGPQNIKVKKINPSVITSPEFRTDVPDKRSPKLKWFEIEVEFDVDKIPKGEVIDELTFKYTVLFNGKLLTGEVTHVNIPNGSDHYSVMYMSPRAIDRATMGAAFTAGMVDNIWVSVERQGQKLATDSLKKTAIPNAAQTPGLLVPKSETPFQVLWWDRYEAVKPAVGH